MFVSCVYTKQAAASFTHSHRTPGVFLDYCVSPLSRLHVLSPYQTKNVSVSKCKTYRAHTNPEGFKAVVRAKDESDAEREREDVVREHVEERAEVLPALTAQHAPSRAGEAVGDLERGDEGYRFAHGRRRLVVAEEVTKDLGILFEWERDGRRDVVRVFRGERESMTIVPVSAPRSAKRCSAR